MTLRPYSTRIPDVTQQKLLQISLLTEPAEFVRSMIDLMENYVFYEHFEPVKYDEDTGKPVSFEWKPYGRFNGVIYLHNGFHTELTVSDEIKAYLLSFRGKAHVFIDGPDVYVLSDYKTGYDGGITWAGIKIQRAEVIQTE